MVLTAILSSFASYGRLTAQADDDWADRLSHLYTVVLLVVLAVFISGGTYVGSPIECWTPANFPAAHVSYVKSHCWMKNTYAVPFTSEIPQQAQHRRELEITYYQWVPIILLFQAFCFKIPALVWRKFNGGSGINVDKMVNMVVGTQLAEPGKCADTVGHIAAYLDKWLEAHRQYKYNALVRMRQKANKVLCFLCSKRDGTFLTGLYLFVKVLYLGNVVAQFWLLDVFVDGWWGSLGLDVLLGTVQPQPRDVLAARFPLVTLCDFRIRQLNNVQEHTTQCVLPINLFNQKIFLLLWWFYMLVALLTTGNLLFWIYRALFYRTRISYIKKYLKILDELRGEEEKKLVRKFADQYLRDDGVFILRIIARNTNDILLSDIIRELWHIYKNKPMIKKSLEVEDLSDSLA